MIKKVLKVAFVVAIAMVVGINVYNAQKTEVLSDVAMANVEALADNEVNPLCPNGCLDNGPGCYCYNWYPYYREAGEK